MSKPWRLTPRAEAALVDIARWTLRTFGLAQANAYEQELLARCQAIADGTALSEDCSALVAEAKGLRFARCGSHFVVFTELDGEVVVLDVLHARMDLPARLRSLRSDG